MTKDYGKRGPFEPSVGKMPTLYFQCIRQVVLYIAGFDLRHAYASQVEMLQTTVNYVLFGPVPILLYGSENGSNS